MSSNDLLKTRIKRVNSGKIDGKSVLYVMSRDQRVQDNHALLCAQKHALAQNLPLAVVFCLQNKSGVRSREHYEFMLDGLSQVEKELKELNIAFIMLIGSPEERLETVFYDLRPTAVYFDFNSLRGPKTLLDHLSALDTSPNIYLVDTHNVVPVWATSDKQEVGAYTIRPKIHKKFEMYLTEPEQPVVHPLTWKHSVIPTSELQATIQGVLDGISESGIVINFSAGAKSAHELLENFIANKLDKYSINRNGPSENCQSDLSPYLHFGNISSLRVALRLRDEALKSGADLHLLSSSKMPKPENARNALLYGIDCLIEEMIVRKELADNFCYYNQFYDSLGSAPSWARISLEIHKSDHREHVYTLKELEDANTHDTAWNAAQRQLTRTGKMHGYMRMYWAKKVLEWTESPEQAITSLVYLNDHYSIDGGDPNGYAGIMWSVAGIHDRPWQEREIFGVIRYMNYGGLKRKFDIMKYEQQWQ